MLYLFDKVDALLKIHSEVDELPLYSFLAVFLLLQDEHVMVKELLKTLVRVVDAELLERVVLKNTSHVYQSQSITTQVAVV